MMFLKSQSGSVATITAVTMTVMVGAGGFAVDYSNSVNAQARAQDAVDAGVIAAVRSIMRDPDGDYEAVGRRIALENLDDDIEATISVSRTERDTVVVSAEGHVDGFFSGLYRPDGWPVAASAEAGPAEREGAYGAEVALALDLTGSMVFRGVADDLLTETRGLISSLQASPDPEGVYVAIAPFGGLVNVGVHRTNWLSGLASGDYAPGRWGGCVVMRERGDLDLGDAPPSAGLWRPYLWPSEHTARQWFNAWEGKPASDFRVGMTQEEHRAADEADDWSDIPPLGPNVGCMTPIRPLTNDHAGTLAYIDGIEEFSYSNGTILASGLSWAWRAVSPAWRGEWGGETPADLPSADGRKIVVFLSDGGNKWNHTGGVPHVTAYGMADDPLAARHDLTDSDNLDARFLATCAAIREREIELYTILFANSGTDEAALMEACAGSGENFFLAGNASALAETFEKLSGKIVEGGGGQTVRLFR